MARAFRWWSTLAVAAAFFAIASPFSRFLNCRIAQAQQSEDPPAPSGPTYPYVEISQDGFSPSEVNLDEETYDTFYATFNPGDFYIPDPITFTWSITSVQIDSEGTGHYVEADHATTYDCEWTDPNQPDFGVGMVVYAPGNWLVYVGCVAHYPDGYTRVFPQEIRILASKGSDKLRKG